MSKTTPATKKPLARRSSTSTPNHTSGARRNSESDPSSKPDNKKTQDVSMILDVTTDKPQSTPNPDSHTSCPCGKSIPGDYKVDCSSCDLIWHATCLTMKGLTDKMIKRMIDYKCPRCWTHPSITTAENPQPWLH